MPMVAKRVVQELVVDITVLVQLLRLQVEQSMLMAVKAEELESEAEGLLMITLIGSRILS